MKGSTAVVPAPIIHELYNSSKSSPDPSGPSKANANSEGLLVVRGACTQSVALACIDQLQAGTHTTEVLNQLLPSFSHSEVMTSKARSNVLAKTLTDTRITIEASLGTGKRRKRRIV